MRRSTLASVADAAFGLAVDDFQDATAPATAVTGGLSAATALELMGVAYPELKGLFAPLSALAVQGCSTADYQQALARVDAPTVAAITRLFGAGETGAAGPPSQINASQIYAERAAAMSGSPVVGGQASAGAGIDAEDIFACRAAAGGPTHH